MRLPPFIYLSFAQEDLMSYDDLSKILLLFFTKKKKKRDVHLIREAAKMYL